MEGLICDRSMTLAHLMGVLKTFYAKIGIVDLRYPYTSLIDPFAVASTISLSATNFFCRFKPTFNPYTEPSMEIFGFHTSLKKYASLFGFPL